MSWHVEPGLLASYARRELDIAHSFSIEAHLLECAACRERVSLLVDAGRLERVWSEVEHAVVAPRPGPIEALLARFGAPEHLARLLVSTPSLTASWLSAVAVCLVFAVTAAHVSQRGLLVFLALAPLLPLAGVAVAFGPGLDPTYEISLASPMRGFRLLMIRAAAVLVTTTVLAALAAVALPEFSWLAVAWLLPSLALTALGLALSTYLRSTVAFACVGMVWIASASLSAGATGDGFAAFEAPAQLGFIVAGLAAVTVLLRRREAFDREGDR